MEILLAVTALVGVLSGLLMGYWQTQRTKEQINVSKIQHIINVRMTWVNDLRAATAEFASTAMTLFGELHSEQVNDSEKWYRFGVQGNKVILLLAAHEKNHQELAELISTVATSIPYKEADLGDICDKIVFGVGEILRDEWKVLERK